VSTDAYGNTSATSAPFTLVIDATPPTGTVTVTGKTVGSVVYVGGSTASLSLSFSGAPAGLATMSVSLDGGAYSAPVAYSSTVTVTGIFGDGTHTVSVLVTDKAGNTVVVTRTFVLDTTGPGISSAISAPGNGAAYDISQKITLTYGATDPASGLASVSATIDGKAWASGTALAAFSLAAGAHTVVITATDAVGNVSTSTFTIIVHATVAGLQAAVTAGVSSGAITASSVASSLQADLTAAQNALAANNHPAAQTALASFVSHAGSNKITAAYAALLKAWAADLSAAL
jgi:hypothetical protein